jgi:hypothetical protein
VQVFLNNKENFKTNHMKKTLTLLALALTLGTLVTNAQQHQVASKNPKTESKIGDKFFA